MNLEENVLREHKNFVDLMFPRFGLENHPGYCPIQVRPLFRRGCFHPGKIYILDKLEQELIAPVTWHESGHYLHSLVREEKAVKKSNIRYLEFIADLSLLTYLELSEGLNTHSLNKYNIPQAWSHINRDLNKALNIVSDKKELLKILATSNQKRAMDLARKYNRYKNPFGI